MSIAEYSGYIVQYCMIRNIYVMVYLRHDGIWPTVPLVRFNVIENMTNYCGQVRHQNRTDKGRVQKPESRVSSVRGGGVPPLSANFFPLVFPSAMGAGGVPPLSANFFSVSF